MPRRTVVATVEEKPLIETPPKMSGAVPIDAKSAEAINEALIVEGFWHRRSVLSDGGSPMSEPTFEEQRHC